MTIIDKVVIIKKNKRNNRLRMCSLTGKSRGNTDNTKRKKYFSDRMNLSETCSMAKKGNLQYIEI